MIDVIFIPGRMGVQTDEQEIVPTEDRQSPIIIRVHSCPFAVNSLDTSANAELFPIAAQA
jgi:hypothetical protein